MRISYLIGVTIPILGSYAIIQEGKVSIGVILFVIIASVIIGITVANFAKMKGYIEGKATEVKEVGRPDESLQSAIFKEISKLPLPADDQRQAAEAISNLFTEQLDEKVSLVSQQLNKKHETVINESKQTAEIIKNKYEKLSVEKKQTEAVIRSIAEGLVVVNEKGDVLLMNPAAEKLLGVKREEKIGKSILEDLKNEQLISIATKFSDKERKEGIEIELSSGEDETRKVLRASSAVIEDEYGKTVGMVSVLTDVTKQKELDEMKSIFVSNVSHELRTPIVAIQKSISVILDKIAGSLTERQERFLTIVKDNTEKLSKLIDDLLDLSKIESKKMVMSFRPYNIEKIVDDACGSLTAWAKSKDIKIEKRVQRDLPEINLDPDRISQVFNNLIGNAIKFTPTGGLVTVEAKLEERGDKMELSVADTGIGIARGDLSKVFDRFQQVGERVATDISGTGLGLSIAKEIVEMHGGKIWAESEKGRGAKFIFTVPVTRGG